MYIRMRPPVLWTMAAFHFQKPYRFRYTAGADRTTHRKRHTTVSGSGALTPSGHSWHNTCVVLLSIFPHVFLRETL